MAAPPPRPFGRAAPGAAGGTPQKGTIPMKVASTSDWRENIDFDTAMVVATLAPGEPTRCSVCGGESAPVPREELWAIKHRHPNNHSGHVRFYCAEHLPKIDPPKAPVEAARPRAAARPARKPAAAPRPVVIERERAKCPDCFIEVSAAGECGMCGRQVG